MNNSCPSLPDSLPDIFCVFVFGVKKWTNLRGTALLEELGRHSPDQASL